MLQVWTAKDVDVRDRYPAIAETIGDTLCRCDVITDMPMDRFDARVEHVALGDISLLRYASIGTQIAQRSMQHVKADNGDSTLLYLPITASMAVSQGDSVVEMPPGTACLVPLNKPLVGHFLADNNDLNTAIQVRVPTELLQRAEPRITNTFNKRLSLGPGSGRLMLTIIQSVFDEAAHMRAGAANPVSRTIVDAICSLAADTISDNPELLESRSTNAVNQARIIDFVHNHLGNADLNVEMISKACHMSERCIHRAFEDHALSVTGFIREQRLQHCKAEIENPAMTHLTIGEIAYRWGFKDVSHFSRAYRARFDEAPSASRPSTSRPILND